MIYEIKRTTIDDFVKRFPDVTITARVGVIDIPRNIMLVQALIDVCEEQATFMTLGGATLDKPEELHYVHLDMVVTSSTEWAQLFIECMELNMAKSYGIPPDILKGK